MSNDTPFETRMVAIGWAVELPAECGDVDGAPAPAREHRMDEALGSGIGCRPVLLATRGAVAMAEGRRELAVTQYLTCGRDLIERGVSIPVSRRSPGWSSPRPRVRSPRRRTGPR